MSINAELILRTVLTKGIETFMKNPLYVEQLFVNLDRESAQEMRTYFENNMVWVDINYPREATKVPGIVILLQSESESNAFLNDHMSMGEVPSGTGFDDFSEEVLGGGVIKAAASASSLSGEGPVLYGPEQASGGTSSTLSLAGLSWRADQWRTRNSTVHIIGGTGVGQQREIASNTRNVLVVKPNWRVAPDATSMFVIRGEEQEVVGEPRSLYMNQKANTTERKGSYYQASYQLEVIGNNPEITIFLATIVKSILTLSRTFLESQGIINMQLGASDLIPRREYQPDFAYMRAITVQFVYPFSVFIQHDYATELRLVLESSCQSGCLHVVSDTRVP